MIQSKKWIVRASAALVVAALCITVVYSTADADSSASVPGLPEDPIVTKSYVDKKVSELVAIELEKIKGQGGGSSGSGTSTSSTLEVVTVPFGQKLSVNAGGELIVRTGKAIAFSNDKNGLSDMTDGLDIAPGKPVGNNHLIVFPRDGRGVEADPKQQKGLIVLVRGGYTLQ